MISLYTSDSTVCIEMIKFVGFGRNSLCTKNIRVCGGGGIAPASVSNQQTNRSKLLFSHHS
jgi:hypothetical protein